MKYGHFSDDSREFIITRPDTPRPWINYLTNGAYSALVSQTGGGYSFVGGPAYDRITRADPDIAVSDRPGRYIYVRDDQTGEYFSLGWQPVKRTPEYYECRHSPGLTTIISKNMGIIGKIAYFVPLDDNLEIWHVTLENTRSTQAEISIFTYVEWVAGNYTDDLEERQLWNLFNESTFQDNYIVATKRAWRRPDPASVVIQEMRPAGGAKFIAETMNANQSWGKYAFIALTVPVDGFDCSRQAFFGYSGQISNPEVVEKGVCTNSEAIGEDAVGVLQVRFSIPPGEKISFDVLVGVALHEGDPSGIAARYGEPGEVERKLADVVHYWDTYLAKLTVDTPDPDFNRAVNIWDNYQNWVAARLPVMQSLYCGGSSKIALRDACFDLLGALPMDYEFSRIRLGNIIKHQYKDGSVPDYWELRSDVATRTGYLDGPLWLIFALDAYLRETGDMSFLEERIPFYYSRPPASVYDHLVRAVEYMLNKSGPRGLALLGPGDWDEDLDHAGREGQGESILTSQMLVLALLNAAEIAKRVGDKTRSRLWSSRARSIRGKLNQFVWSGEWYMRAIDDRDLGIGTKTDSTGRIYVVTQSWAVISGIAPPDRALSAMDAVGARLDTPFGPALLAPAYSRPKPQIGTITRYPPGIRSNGGINTIAACWAIIAECKLGRGTRAYEILRKTLYSLRAVDQDRYKAEPYVHAEYVLGPGSRNPGEGMFTWTSGVAAWVWRTCIDWICGVRPDYKGLRIDPTIPSNWPEFTVIRPFRDAVYRIWVKNPYGVEKGVRSITVDGRKSHSNSILPDFSDQKLHEVEVIMG